MEDRVTELAGALIQLGQEQGLIESVAESSEAVVLTHFARLALYCGTVLAPFLI